MNKRLFNNILLILFPLISISLLSWLFLRYGNPLQSIGTKPESFFLFVLCYILIFGFFLANFFIRRNGYSVICAIVGFLLSILFLLPIPTLRFHLPPAQLIAAALPSVGLYTLSLTVIYLLLIFRRGGKR